MATASSVPDRLTDEAIEVARAELLETDGEPLETPWHRAQINLLIDSLVWRWRERTDFFIGGNMFIYYSRTQARERKYKGPDFFVVDHVDGKRKRPYWWVFEEDNRFPDTIIELASPTTLETDLTTKKTLYETVFKTPEYFCFDPDSGELRGWRLQNRRYQLIESSPRGWLWSEQLETWLGEWQGAYLEVNDTWLRFFDEQEQLLPTKAEAMEAEVAALKSRLATEQKGKSKERK